MNIQKIKERARQVQNINKAQYVHILLIIILLELIPNLFDIGEDILSQLLYTIISIVFIAVSHGYIVSSLKMIRNQSHMLTSHDAFVGFKRFKELFSTYLLTDVLITVLGIIASFILTIFLGIFIIGFPKRISSQVVLSNDYTQILSAASNLPVYTLFAFLLFCLIIIVLIFIISSYFFAVPYLLERYNLKNMNAIKESFRFMKGHIWDIIKLDLSFLGWMMVVTFIQIIICEMLSFLPILGSLIASIISSIVGVYTYLPRYYLSRAIFFEELAYYHYKQTNI